MAKKVTVRKLQQLTGLLNFIGRAVVPGRAFTRRLYAKMGTLLKPHHHVRVDSEMRCDLQVWRQFLRLDNAVVRPFIDLAQTLEATQIQFYMDSSSTIGAGGFWNGHYFYLKWPSWLKSLDLSIGYLELYALTAGILLWSHELKNKRIVIFCNNQSVVHMLNNTTSKCKYCMILIRMIVLAGLRNNVRFFGRWLSTGQNYLADALSWGEISKFKKLAPAGTDTLPTKLPHCLWPIPKVWFLVK